MSSNRGSSLQLETGARKPTRSVPSFDVSTPVLIALITGAVVLGAAVAWVAARVYGIENPALAAGLGALGAISATAVGAISVAAAKHGVAGRTAALVRAGSPTHPLLRRLMTEAPGTYVHSLAAANLSEAAAEAIGADPLVSRVGAYYHDIGKLRRPGFFFENQDGDENPHEGARPSESADIIMSHVVDGVSLGESHDLPDSVLGVIRQHHGTSLVRYFYHKAAEADATAFEADFRYPGEPPSSREAAIVMLADASEASVRAQAHPDTAQIRQSIDAVIAERRRDGQLGLSGLTESDLLAIRDVFVKQLVGFRHVRCPYPSQLPPTEGAPDANQRPESPRP